MHITVCTIDPKTFKTHLTDIELAEGARVTDALLAASLNPEKISGYAVYARKVSADTILHDGDRLDIACDLLIDPMRARQLRAENKQSKAIPKPRHGGKHQLIKPLEV